MWPFLYLWGHSEVKRSKVKFWFIHYFDQNGTILGHNLMRMWPLNDLIDTQMSIYDDLACMSAYVKIDGYSCNIDQLMAQDSFVLGQTSEKIKNWPLTFWPLNDLIDIKMATYADLAYMYVYVKIDGYSCHIDQLMAQNSSIFRQNSEKIEIWPLTFWPLNDLIDIKMASYADLAYM